MPAAVAADGSDLDGAVELDGAKPGPQRVKQRAGEAITVIRVFFNEPAQRRAGHHAHVAGKGAFVFLVGDDGVNFAAADQRDVAGFGATQIFLEKDAFGVVDVRKPGAGVLDGFAEDGVNRARG